MSRDRRIAHNARRRIREDEVLNAANDLDDDDHSIEAQQIRETAEDIQDRRDSEHNRNRHSN